MQLNKGSGKEENTQRAERSFYVMALHLFQLDKPHVKDVTAHLMRKVVEVAVNYTQ